MADKDCNCLQCKAERRWKDNPKAEALISKLSQLAVSGSEALMEGEEPHAGDPITLLAWIGMSLYGQAQDCAQIMSAFDQLTESEQDQLLDRFREDSDPND